jgi:hypothetical protein
MISKIDQLLPVAEQFNIAVKSILPFGRGHINTTYKVNAGENTAYLLQKINRSVFKDIAGLMHNIEMITHHIQNELHKESHPHPEQAGLTLIKAVNGKNYILDDNNDAWRLFRFIEHSHTHPLIGDPKLAQEGSRAFGQFQRLIAKMDPTELTITIPNFHHLPTRLDDFNRAVEEDLYGRSKLIGREINYIHRTKDSLCEIQKRWDRNQIPTRITHNDTKLNNVLFSSEGSSLCVIDLDTVMPGIFQFDFSDTVRTMAITAEEDEPNLDNVQLSPDLFFAITQGYLETTRDILTDTELELLAPAANFMPFIIGLRFLTDYLQGDFYFKTHRPNQNLDRARCQFKLSQDIERQQTSLRKIVASLI